MKIYINLTRALTLLLALSSFQALAVDRSKVRLPSYEEAVAPRPASATPEARHPLDTLFDMLPKDGCRPAPWLGQMLVLFPMMSEKMRTIAVNSTIKEIQEYKLGKIIERGPALLNVMLMAVPDDQFPRLFGLADQLLGAHIDCTLMWSIITDLSKLPGVQPELRVQNILTVLTAIQEKTGIPKDAHAIDLISCLVHENEKRFQRITQLLLAGVTPNMSKDDDMDQLLTNILYRREFN